MVGWVAPAVLGGLARRRRAHRPAARLAGDVATSLHSSGSGRELHAKDHGDDVTYAAELDVSTVVPVLRDGRFVNVSAVPRGD
jgi:phosphosulfolactate phosphohydrolase-like enzyme